MKRSAMLLLALLATAAAGCGDGPRKDYGDQVSAAAREVNRALIDIGTAVSQNADVAAIAGRIDREIGVVDRTVAKLEAIEPPEGAGDAHAKLIEGLEDYLATLRRAATVAKNGTIEEVVAALRTITEGTGTGAEKIREASDELEQEGFRVSR